MGPVLQRARAGDDRNAVRAAHTSSMKPIQPRTVAKRKRGGQPAPLAREDHTGEGSASVLATLQRMERERLDGPRPRGDPPRSDGKG